MLKLYLLLGVFNVRLSNVIHYHFDNNNHDWFNLPKNY